MGEDVNVLQDLEIAKQQLERDKEECKGRKSIRAINNAIETLNDLIEKVKEKKE